MKNIDDDISLSSCANEREEFLMQLPDARFNYYVDDNRKLGFRDFLTSDPLIPCIYDDAGPFCEGLANVKK